MGWFDELFDDSSDFELPTEDSSDSLGDLIGSLGSGDYSAPLGGLDMSVSGNYDQLLSQLGGGSGDAPLGGYDMSVAGNYERLMEQLGSGDYSAPLGGLDMAVPGNYAQLIAQLGGGSGDAPLGGLDMSVAGNYATLMQRLLSNPESGTSSGGSNSSLLDMLSRFVSGSDGQKSPLASLLGLGATAGQVGSALTAKGSPALSAPAMTQDNPHATSMAWRKMAKGGATKGCGCQGALGLLKGASTGQLDNVPIAASHGEYVMDADSVSALGDGNTDAGAARLDKMRENLRRHKRSAPATNIPPKAKSPEQYLKGGK